MSESIKFFVFDLLRFTKDVTTEDELIQAITDKKTDINISTAITLTKDLDLGGLTITAGVTNALTVANSSDVTIKNGTITLNNTATTAAANSTMNIIGFTGTGKLTLGEGLILTASNKTTEATGQTGYKASPDAIVGSANCVNASSTGTVTIDGATLSSDNGYGVYASTAASLVINSGSISTTGIAQPIKLASGGTFEMHGGEVNFTDAIFGVTAVTLENVTSIKMDDGTISTEANFSETDNTWKNCVNAALEIPNTVTTLEITGGTIESKNGAAIQAYGNNVTLGGTGASVTVTGKYGLVTNSWSDTKNTFTIGEGVTITATKYGIYSRSNSTYVVDGGTINGGEVGVYQTNGAGNAKTTYGTIQLKSGTVTGTTAIVQNAKGENTDDKTTPTIIIGESEGGTTIKSINALVTKDGDNYTVKNFAEVGKEAKIGDFTITPKDNSTITLDADGKLVGFAFGESAKDASITAPEAGFGELVIAEIKDVDLSKVTGAAKITAGESDYTLSAATGSFALGDITANVTNTGTSTVTFTTSAITGVTMASGDSVEVTKGFGDLKIGTTNLDLKSVTSGKAKLTLGESDTYTLDMLDSDTSLKVGNVTVAVKAAGATSASMKFKADAFSEVTLGGAGDTVTTTAVFGSLKVDDIDLNTVASGITGAATITKADATSYTLSGLGAAAEFKLGNITAKISAAGATAGDTVTFSKTAITGVKLGANGDSISTTSGGFGDLAIDGLEADLSGITGAATLTYDGSAYKLSGLDAAAKLTINGVTVDIAAAGAAKAEITFTDAGITNVKLGGTGDSISATTGFGSLKIDGLDNVDLTGITGAAKLTYDGTSAYTLDSLGTTADASFKLGDISVDVKAATADKAAIKFSATAITEFTFGGAGDSITTTKGFANGFKLKASDGTALSEMKLPTSGKCTVTAATDENDATVYKIEGDKTATTAILKDSGVTVDSNEKGTINVVCNDDGSLAGVELGTKGDAVTGDMTKLSLYTSDSDGNPVVVEGLTFGDGTTENSGKGTLSVESKSSSTIEFAFSPVKDASISFGDLANNEATTIKVTKDNTSAGTVYAKKDSGSQEAVLEKVTVGVNETYEIKASDTTGSQINLTVENGLTTGDSTKAANIITVNFSDNETISDITFGRSVTAATLTMGGTEIIGTDVTINGKTVNVDLGTAGDTYVYKVVEGAGIIDLTSATSTEFTVSKTGAATQVIPKVGDTATITIGSTEYTYTAKTNANGTAYFTVGSDAATGFVFTTKDDQIVFEDGIPNGFTLYETSATKDKKVALPTITGDGVVSITKNTSDYSLVVGTGAILKDKTGVTVDFSGMDGNDYATVIFNGSTGKITSVYSASADPIEGTTLGGFSPGTEIKVTGNKATKADEGILFSNTATAPVVGTDKTTATKNGNYTFVVDEDDTADPAVYVRLDDATDTVYSTGDFEKVALAGASGTITYNNGSKEDAFKYVNTSGNAYFTADGGAITGFVFYGNDDAITIPAKLQVVTNFVSNLGYYDVENTTVSTTLPYKPTIVNGATANKAVEYTLTMLSGGTSGETLEFEMSKIAAEAVVKDDTKTLLTFGEDATGTNSITFGEEAINGLNITAGTVELTADAAEMLNGSGLAEGEEMFQLNGASVNITAKNTNGITYDATNKALYGIATNDAIAVAGEITKFYVAGTTAATITFGDPDAETPQAFSVTPKVAGTVKKPSVFFTVESDETSGFAKAVGFTFVNKEDKISGNVAGMTFYDGASDTTGFAAPTVANAEGTAVTEGVTITKTEAKINNAKTNTDCYSITVDGLEDGNVVTFGGDSGTKLIFNQIDSTPDIYFKTTGELLQIAGLATEGDSVTIQNAKDVVYIGQTAKTVEAVNIQGTEGTLGGYTYEIYKNSSGNLASSIKDLTGGAKVIAVPSITSALVTKAGEDGMGMFTFGSAGTTSVSVAGTDSDGVEFQVDATGTEIALTGVASVDATASVIGSLNGLSLNGGAFSVSGNAADAQFTFSGTSLAGLTNGASVVAADSITSFITADEGTFKFFDSAAVQIVDDKEVKFSLKDSVVSAIAGLSGTAVGDFIAGGVSINSQTISITGEDSVVGVTGNDATDNISAIHSLGGDMATDEFIVTEIGDASLVGVDGLGKFTFENVGGASFVVDGTNTTETEFIFGEAGVAAINGVDAAEKLAGDFSADGGVVLNGVSTIEIANDKLISLVGSDAIEGLGNGADVKQADGFTSAKTDEEGQFTFKNGSISVAGDDSVTFVLDGAGNVIGIDDVSDTATIRGHLYGIAIGGGASISVVGADGNPNENLVYDASKKLLSGVAAGDTVYLADSAASIEAAGNVTFMNGSESQAFYTDADSLTFAVKTSETGVVATAVAGLSVSKVLGGALTELTTVNDVAFKIANDTDFSVVGGEDGLSEIRGLTNGVEVTDAAGATKALTDGKAGVFTFDNPFTVAGEAKIQFSLNENAVTGISGIADGVSVTGALNELKFNGSDEALQVTPESDELTVYANEEGLNLGGLKDGASVAATGGVSNFITDAADNAAFTILGKEFNVTDKDGVTFATDGAALTAITGLSGTAIGGFSGITVNEVAVQVTNDDEIAVDGDGSAVTAVRQLGADAVDTKIDVTADGVETFGVDKLGTFTFNNSASFAVDGDNTEETTFTMTDGAVTAIDHVDDGEILSGNFEDEIAVNGAAVQVANNGAAIQLAGASILGLGAGAEIKAADGFTSAVTDAENTNGEFTFAGGSTVTLNGNTAEVTFLLDGEGKLIGVTGLTGGISGALNGVQIGEDQIPISVTGADGTPNTNLVYDAAAKSLSGVADGDIVYRADSAEEILAAGGVTFMNGSDSQVFTTTDETGLTFAVTSSADGVVANEVSGLDEAAVLGGDLSDLATVNEVEFNITGDADGFSVVGGADAQGLSEVIGLSDGVVVESAGGAAIARTENGANGTFTFGASAFIVDNSQEEITFGLDTETAAVTGISGIAGDVSVTGALNGLTLDGEALEITGGTSNWFTVSGQSVAGLTDGNAVVQAAGKTDFLTKESGNFEILGTPMTIENDADGVTFVAGESLAAINGLSGTATGDFTNGLAVNGFDVQVTNDEEAAVIADENGVTEIHKLGTADGGEIEVTAETATIFGVEEGMNGTFKFNGGDSFAVTNNGETETTFTTADGKVTEINGVDDHEIITGKFDEGIAVDGANIQVTNSEAIKFVNGGESGTGVFGLKDGAEIVSSGGMVVAVAVEDGTYKFGEQSFTIAGDSDGYVGFNLDEEGKVTGVFGFDGQITGDLNGLTINGGDSFRVVNGETPNTQLTYDAGTKELSGIANGDKVISANGASTAVASSTEDPFTVEFDNGTFFISGTSSVKFAVTDKNQATAVDGLKEGGIIGGAIQVLDQINGGEFDVEDADGDFSVVGGAGDTVGEIIGITGDAVVNNAGGATIARTDGEGTFQFGGGSTYVLAGGSEITFALDADTGVVTGIKDVDPTETVTGSLNGLTFNDGTEALNIGGQSNWFTFSGQSIAGLEDGANVVNGGGANDFVTKESGTFQILGTSMAIDGDDNGVTFKTDTENLTGIAGLEGTATGNFENGVDVNTEKVQVTGDDNIEVTSDGSVVTAIAGVSGTVELTEIGSATQVSTDGNGEYNFVAAGQTFGLENSDGVVFGLGVSGVNAIDEVGDDEIVTGDFTNGIAVNGAEVKVTNGEAIQLAGASISGLKDGAVVEATGDGAYTSAKTDESGSFTFTNGTFSIANDDDGVTFQLNDAGEVIGVTGLDGEISGNLNGVVIGEEPNISVVGASGPNTNLTYADGVLSGLVDQDSVYAADHATTVKAGVSGTFTFVDNEQTFTTTDGDGVDFIINEGTTEVTAVDQLAANETLTGSIGGLSTVNGVSFDIESTADFGVVGGEGKLNAIVNLSGSTTVKAAGNAELAVISGDGDFTFATGQNFKVMRTFGQSAIELDTAGTEFVLNEDAEVTAINNFQGFISGDLNQLELNGNLIDVSGDESDLGAFVNTGGKLELLGGVGSASGVTVNSAGGASFIATNVTNGTVEFASGQTFEIVEDKKEPGVMFRMDGDNAIGLGLLEGQVKGDFTGGLTVNGPDNTVQVSGDESIVVEGDENGVVSIGDVNKDANVVNAGGASFVYTADEGKFTFADSGEFEISVDSSVTFELAKDAAASVVGISDFSEGTIRGGLSKVAFNDQTMNVEGDSDNIFSYMLDASGNATLGDVGGDTVTVNAAGGASVVQVVSDGEYTFENKETFKLSGGDNSVLFSDKAIDDLDGTVEGNFEDVAVNGKSIKIGGNSAIGVVGSGSGVSEIFNLGDGAIINAADDVTVARTNEEGTFTFADGKQINIAGDDEVTFNLDGQGNLVSIDDLDEAATVSGDLNGLDFSGSGSAIDVRDNTNLWYNNGTLSGVVNGNTVISADGATTVRTAGDGTYDFNGDVYVVTGDQNGVVDFVLDADKAVTGIENLDENATVEGALNGKTINNGEAIDVSGDDSFGAVAAAAGLSKLTGLGGTSVAVKAADGATVFETDTDGTFKFFNDDAFTVVDEGGVKFTTDGDKVTAIDEVSGTVDGNFADGVAINGNNVKVTDADNLVKVTASDKVERIDDVDGEAVILSSGGASFVGTKTQGAFQFESDQYFVTSGDDSVTFALDGNGNVTGVSNFDLEGTLEFDTLTTDLAVNSENISVGTTTNASLSLASGSINYVKGVTTSITGLTNATVEATGATKNVNGTDIVISDGDDDYKVIVSGGSVAGLQDINGNATVSVAAAMTIGTRNTADASDFVVGGEKFNFNDTLDGAFNMSTNEDGKLTGISAFEGAAVLESPTAAAISVNDQDLFISSGKDSVTLSTDGATLGVNGLQDGDMISGADANTSITVAGSSSIVEGQGTKVTVNNDGYELLNDEDGIVMNGNREAVGLDENGSLKVEQAGTYNVNGTADLQAEKDDRIVGDTDGAAAYIYDPNAIVVGPNTPISEIEEMLGLPEYASQLGGDDLDGTDPFVEDPLTKAQTDAIFGPSSTTDLNGPIEIFANNDTATTQAMNLADTKFTKKVHMYRGPQAVAFNNEGGNLALVDKQAQGAKAIAFGNGGDVAVVDMAAASGNSTDITGGEGDDNVIVRGSAPVNFNMSGGGRDIVGTFAKANARINLTNYDPTTGSGIMIYERNARDFAQAIADKLISFGDGLLNIGSGSNQSKVTFGGNTDMVGSTLVNLFNPYGIKQAVGFTNSAGGAVDGSASSENLIMIGNSDGTKTGGSTLTGGTGNDTAFAGGGDEVDLGEGNNVVELQDSIYRGGANVRLGRGRTTINNFNGTFNLEHGDIISGVDLATANVHFDGTNVVMESANGSYGVIANAKPAKSISYDLAESADLVESADETTVSLKTADGDYTNVMFADDGIRKAAIAKTNGVVDVQLDEDARADYYIGDNSGMTFYGYNGAVDINLETGTGKIDNVDVTIDGFNKFAAGTGETKIQGSDANEVLVAGTGNDSLYGGGGKNLLVGHSASGKEGQTTFLVLGYAGGAANTVQSFTFVNDNSWTNNSITADIIDVDTNTNLVKTADISGNDVVLTVQNRNSDVTESVVIEGAVGKNIFVANRASGNAAIGQVNTTNLTYDKFANFYIATGKNATVKVASDLDVARVYLGNSSVNGDTFQGDIHVIDATGTTAKAELAGNDYDNTIFAGDGDTSLWGGVGGDDLLVGGNGMNTFVYNYGNGSDTVMGANDGDIVDLNSLTLDQIASTEISTEGVVLNFTDGGKLTVNGTADVNYQVAGATYAVDKSTGTWARKA